MQQSDSMVVVSPTSLTVRAQQLPSHKEVPLFVQNWPGKPGSGRVLFIVHGLGEHAGRYSHLPHFLGEEFESFYAMDNRGHGRSGGIRGYVPSFDLLIEDIERAVAEVQARNHGKNLVLLAHSFGGLIGLRMLLSRKKVPFRRSIISAPLLGVKLRVPRWKKLLGEILGRTLSRVQLSNEVNPSYLSHDPQVVEAYVKDRLVHSKITPRLYLEMTKTMEWVRSSTGPLACPTLFIVPGEDRVVDSKVTVEFFRNLKYRDKELLEYPDMYHEALNEIGKERVFEDIRKWMQKTNW